MAASDFHAMGTTVSVIVPADLSAATECVRALFATWETALSRFLPESELSRLNARAGELVAVSPLLLRVLRTALDAARASDGLYDPTLERQLMLLGYDRSFDTLPAEQPGRPAAVLLGGGWRAIALDADAGMVRLPPGIGLDFGGIAKGMAVDAALEELARAGVDAALVSAGGDLAVRGAPPAMAAWPVAVVEGGPGYTVALHHGALATSGIARRHWMQGGIPRHHLLDPRTGLPGASDLRAVTAAAASCAQAEVAAKAAFLLGAQAGAAFLRAHHLAGLLVWLDGRASAAGDWPGAAPAAVTAPAALPRHP